MPIYANIPKDSLISSVISFFLKKIISLKFWHLFLELIYSKPTTWLQYSQAKNDFVSCGYSKLFQSRSPPFTSGTSKLYLRRKLLYDG
jgi:hypothetical protein